MRKIHAQAFVEAEHACNIDILVLVREKGRTRPALPKEIQSYIIDTDYAPDSKWVKITWHTGSIIILRLVTDEIPTDKAQVVLFDGAPDKWINIIDQEKLDGYIDNLEVSRYFDKELAETIEILAGTNINPIDAAPKFKFV
jgi:hypothetical protein